MAGQGDKTITIRVPAVIGQWLDTQSGLERRTTAAQVLYTLDLAIADWALLQERAFDRLRAADFGIQSEGVSSTAEERGITVKFPAEVIKVISQIATYERRSMNAQIIQMLDLAMENWPLLVERMMERRKQPSQIRTPLGSLVAA